MPTIFNRLTEKQCSWRIYYHDIPQSATLARIWSELPDHLYLFEDDFMADAMAGRLPNYSFIEPRYFRIRSCDACPMIIIRPITSCSGSALSHAPMTRCETGRAGADPVHHHPRRARRHL